ncbi:glycosyltransferase [Patescibacteria group bacterium]|nr:glycosyltransferase [Patescibacteria group bacterium]
MKLAIVHDAFMQWGGAENLVLAMSRLWPDAPIYTSVVDERVLPADFPRERLRPSFLQKLPFKKQLYQPLFFLQPLAFEQFNFSEFDIVISSTTKFAKSIITGAETLHICYCNTPARVIWFYRGYIQQKAWGPLIRSLFNLIYSPIISALRTHDYIAAQKVNCFIANSRNVARRIKKFYHRDSTVIYPFVDLRRFRPASPDSQSPETGAFFLLVSRLSGHKRIDIAIDAFNKLGYPLIVIGRGSEEAKYRKMAKKNIKLLGWVSDDEALCYYQHCRAFIYPQEEDFGITALEAQACGKPVIAYKAGGALETIIEGKTGFFFSPQSAEALVEAVRQFETSSFNSRDCIKNAQIFSQTRFDKELKNLVEEKVKHVKEA